jgi:hypothetical protein
MSDLHELPDLAGDVRERVVIPPYAEVSRRVRARRLRGAVGALAAAVVVVGGVAAWQSVATTAGPSIPQPADHTQGPIPPTDESQWRAVVDGTDSHPFEVEGTDDGSLAVVWRALEPGAPTFALVIREADGSVHGMRLDDPVTLTPVPGGWVGMDGSWGHLIGSDGSWSDLGEAASRAPRAGDVVVTGQYSSWLYSPGDRGLSPMPQLEGGFADAYVTPQGDLVTCQHDGRGEIFVSPTGKMIRGLPGETCVVAGRDDDAAVVALGDDPDGGIPMTGLATMSGLTPGHSPSWRFPQIPDLLDGVTSVVVTPDGSTVVTDAGDGRWLVVRPDGDVVEPDRRAGEAFVAGERLYVSSYGLMNGPIFVSDDDGRTWSETTLPGNESKQD